VANSYHAGGIAPPFIPEIKLLPLWDHRGPDLSPGGEPVFLFVCAAPGAGDVFDMSAGAAYIFLADHGVLSWG